MCVRAQKYRLLLWDFDGTVADTLSDGLAIYNELAQRHGLVAVRDPQAVRAMSTRRFLRLHRIPLRKVSRLLREFQQTQAQSIAQVPVHPELEGVVRYLYRRGYCLGIISSNTESNIRTCLRANELEECFAFIMGHSRIFGKRRAITRAFKSQGVQREEVLCIGDEIRDVEAAQAAGVDVAAVTWGFNSRAALLESKPAFVVDSPQELLQVVEG